MADDHDYSVWPTLCSTGRLEHLCSRSGFFNFFLSCIVLSCLVLSCLVLPCLVLSCLVLPCLALSCLVLSCLALNRTSLYYTVLYCALYSSTIFEESALTLSNTFFTPPTYLSSSLLTAFKPPLLYINTHAHNTHTHTRAHIHNTHIHTHTHTTLTGCINSSSSGRHHQRIQTSRPTRHKYTR